MCEYQWGNAMSNVKWSPLESCYVWDCVWGCHGSDYEGSLEAMRAFLVHK